MFPSTTQTDLSKAIIETINAGANIINLSVGLSTSSLTLNSELAKAYDYAVRRGVIVVAAAGNQGNLGNISLVNHPWIIPVGACDEQGMITYSNFGSLIAKQGLMAPGVNITSTSAIGGYVRMSGTSFAAPFVTGTIALLWSIFPNAKSDSIIQAIRLGTRGSQKRIIPRLLDATIIFDELKKLTL